MNCQAQFSSKQLEAIKHIRNWIVHYGRTPSIRDLSKALGYKSPKSAQDILAYLREKNIIEKTVYGGYKLINNPEFGPNRVQTVDVPLVGIVACGTPILAEQNIDSYIPVSTTLVKPGSQYYILRADGDSMNQAGINDGDLVLIRQQPTAEENDKVVALIDDEATIKEFQRKGNVVILNPRSSNKEHKPIILTDDFQVQGIVVTTLPGLEIN